MDGKRHLQFGTIMGLTGYAALATTYSPSEAALFGIGCVVGSLFPDIDLPNTKISKHIPILPKLLNSTFGHRGFIHTPFFIILVNAILYFWLKPGIHFIMFLVGLNIGFLGHLLQDMFNKRGIMFLYPISKKRIRLYKGKCGSSVDQLITIILCLFWIIGVPTLTMASQKLISFL